MTQSKHSIIIIPLFKMGKRECEAYQRHVYLTFFNVCQLGVIICWTLILNVWPYSRITTQFYQVIWQWVNFSLSHEAATYLQK